MQWQHIDADHAVNGCGGGGATMATEQQGWAHTCVGRMIILRQEDHPLCRCDGRKWMTMMALLKVLVDDTMRQQMSATGMMERPKVVAADERRQQTRGNVRRVLALAMMEAKGNSGGSRQV